MPVAYERQRTLTRSSNTRTLSHPRSSSNAVMITFTFISSFILEKNFSELFFGRSSTAHGMRDEENEVFGSRKIGGKFNVAKFRFFFVHDVIRFMSSLTAAVYRMETRCWQHSQWLKSLSEEFYKCYQKANLTFLLESRM